MLINDLRFGRLTLFLAVLLFTLPAYAQLAGVDTAPGDDCSTLPTGATRITADADGDGIQVTLVCDGAVWVQEGIIVLSKTGGSPTPDSGSTATPSGDNGEVQYNVGGTGLGASPDLFWDTGNSRLGVGTNTPGAELEVVGDIHYSGTIVDVSDLRQKENIRNLSDALGKLRYVEGVSFSMKDDPTGRVELGLIAQDVEKVYPELVQTSPNGMKSLNYSGMIGPLVEAVKELHKENKALATENAELARELHELSARMDTIEGTRRPKYRPYN